MSEIEQQVRMAAALLGVKVEVEKFDRPVFTYAIRLSLSNGRIFTRFASSPWRQDLTTQLWSWDNAIHAMESIKPDPTPQILIAMAKQYKLKS